MLPAGERLDARRPAARERELGLVLEPDLAGLDAAAQLRRRAAAGRRCSCPATARRPRRAAGTTSRSRARCRRGAAGRPGRCRARGGGRGRRSRARGGPCRRARRGRRARPRAASASRSPASRLSAGEEHGELVAAEARQRVAGRSAPPSRLPTSCRRRSPQAWPSVSLTALKSSRSTIISTSGLVRLGEHPLQPVVQQHAVGEARERVVHRAVRVAGGLPGAEVDRQQRQEAERDDDHRDLRAGEDHGREREHAHGGDHLEREVAQQVRADGLLGQDRRGHAGEDVVDGEEGERTSRRRRPASPRARSAAASRPRGPPRPRRRPWRGRTAPR